MRLLANELTYLAANHFNRESTFLLLVSVVFIDYTDPLLKAHIEALISDYKQEWIISSVYLQTNTKLNIELVHYQARNQMKLLEKCIFPSSFSLR